MSSPDQTSPGSGDPSPAAGTAPPQAPPKRELRRLVADSVLTGLCPLIPVPLLDDFARDLLRKRVVTRLAAESATVMADSEARILACGYQPPSAGGCARGCLRMALIQPIFFVINLLFRKVMRKIFFFLTIKDAVDTFSHTFHEAYLLRHTLSLGILKEPALTGTGPVVVDPRLLEVRGAVEAVVRDTDTGPVRNLASSAFAGSRRLALGTARRMTRVLRRRRRDAEAEITEGLEREAEAGFGALIDELTRDLESQGGYLEQLETALEQRLGLAPRTSGLRPETLGPAPPFQG